MLDVGMTSSISYNLVAPRPRSQARYTIRELLILGLTLPVRFCPLNKFGPEALGLEIVSLERINEALWTFEREQWRMFQAAQSVTAQNYRDARQRAKRTAATEQKVLPVELFLGGWGWFPEDGWLMGQIRVSVSEGGRTEVGEEDGDKGVVFSSHDFAR
jgi:hypothetical protein